jgi:outer membrane protein assembly factor BamB
MKKIFLFLLGGATILASCNNQQKDEPKNWTAGGEPNSEIVAKPQVSLEQVWATDSVLETPESVFYDQDADVLYVSNIVGKPSEKDGEGYISKLSLEGEILEQKWVTGLDAPKGMAVLNGNLYVTNVDELVEINIASGEISNRYKVDGAQFLNDPVVADGKVLFTDMQANKIHALENGQLTVWKDAALDRPNGLAYNNGQLLVASNGLKVISQNGKEEVIAEGIDASDGIGVVSDNSYLVSNWNGEVYYVVESLEKVKVLDTKDQKVNSADIEYVKEGNLLLVPTFNDNRVVAYRLNMGDTVE